MHILIIGGTRFMGRIVVERLLERGDKVTVFSRGNTRPEWWDTVEHIQGDRTDRPDFVAKLRGKSFDGVIDTQAYRKEDVESAVEAFRGSVGRYVMVSTGSVYLDGKVDFLRHCPFTESVVDWSSLDYSYPEGEDPYGVGKRHCEKWLNENSDVPYTIVRIPVILGEDDPSGRMWWWAQRALDGRGVVVASEDHGVFRTLYSADAADTFLRVLDVPGAANQTYHIAMQEILSIERWAYLVGRAVGNDCAITYVPQEVIGRDESLDGYEAYMSRPLPVLYDLSKAERELGFATTPVEEWVKSTVDWYLNRYDGPDSPGYEHRDAELALADRWNVGFRKLVAES